jgi:hypothetical protein
VLELDPLEDLAALRGRELLVALAELLPLQGVPAPPVPHELVDRLQVLGRWQFGTRPLDRPLRDIEGWIAEALTAPPAAWLVLGHDGQGVTGQAVHYYLATGPLAVFVQERLDALADTPGFPILEAAFAALPALLERLEQAVAQGRIGAGERWLLVASDIVPGRWARLRHAGEAPAWQDVGEPPLGQVLSALAAAGA